MLIRYSLLSFFFSPVFWGRPGKAVSVTAARLFQLACQLAPEIRTQTGGQVTVNGGQGIQTERTPQLFRCDPQLPMLMSCLSFGRSELAPSSRGLLWTCQGRGGGGGSLAEASFRTGLLLRSCLFYCAFALISSLHCLFSAKLPSVFVPWCTRHGWVCAADSRPVSVSALRQRTLCGMGQPGPLLLPIQSRSLGVIPARSNTDRAGEGLHLVSSGARERVWFMGRLS